MEVLMSTETVDLVKEKLAETLELVINLSQQYRFLLIGTGAVIGLYCYITINHGFFRKLGIPGPGPGFLGMGAFTGYTKKGIHIYDQEVMKKYGKVVGIYHMSTPVYIVSDADMIRQIAVKEFQSFVNRMNESALPVDPVVKENILSARDEHWKFTRGILSPTFTSGRMREMSPLIQRCVETTVKNLWTLSEEGEKSLKMRDIFGMFTLDVIASVAFGVELDCQNHPDNPFIKNAKKIVNPGLKVWIRILLCMFLPLMKRIMEGLKIRMIDVGAGNFFLDTANGAIQHRKEEDVVRNDFLQLLLNSHKLEMSREEADSDTYLEFDKTKRRGLTNSEIVGNAFVFLLAGYETTAHALTFMAYNLATNPDCQEKLIQEIDRILNGKSPDYDNVSKLQYLENVLLESLRMFPAVVRISRVASRDIEINGYLIKKGLEVHFPIVAIHNDPEHWPEPEKFEPDRFLPENRPANYNYVYLTFGAGPRNCVGMRLAHMEAKMAIAGILQKYKLKPAPETKIPPDLDKRQMKPSDGMVLMIEKR